MNYEMADAAVDIEENDPQNNIVEPLAEDVFESPYELSTEMQVVAEEEPVRTAAVVPSPPSSSPFDWSAAEVITWLQSERVSAQTIAVFSQMQITGVELLVVAEEELKDMKIQTPEAEIVLDKIQKLQNSAVSNVTSATNVEYRSIQEETPFSTQQTNTTTSHQPMRR